MDDCTVSLIHDCTAAKKFVFVPDLGQAFATGTDMELENVEGCREVRA